MYPNMGEAKSQQPNYGGGGGGTSPTSPYIVGASDQLTIFVQYIQFSTLTKKCTQSCICSRFFRHCGRKAEIDLGADMDADLALLYIHADVGRRRRPPRREGRYTQTKVRNPTSS